MGPGNREDLDKRSRHARQGKTTGKDEILTIVPGAGQCNTEVR